jgi:tetratricopeptide (TPR) repeat protein
MGQRSLASGDPATAVGLLEQALARDRDNREAALLLGYAHLAMGAHQDAGNAFGHILRRSPDEIIPWDYGKGDYHRMQKGESLRSELP